MRQRETALLALSGPDDPWASVVGFTSADLTLYPIEPQASNLAFYVENISYVALTISEPIVDRDGDRLESIRISGTAQILAAHELRERPDEVRTAYSLQNRGAPEVYLVIEVRPKDAYRVRYGAGTVRRVTFDVDDSKLRESAC